MTEYAAIRIDFTLQGLYTCTHSPRIQPASYSNCLRSTETRLTATAPFLSPQVGMQPLRGWGCPGVVWLSPCHPKFHQAPMLPQHRASPALPYS